MISLLFGSVIIIWVLYNVFIRTHEIYSGPTSILGLLLGGFGFGGILFKYGWHSLMIFVGFRENKKLED